MAWTGCEAVAGILDIAEQRDGGLLQHHARVPTVQSGHHPVEQQLGFAVDHDCVNSFLTTEVFVDDGFGNVRPVRDFFD